MAAVCVVRCLSLIFTPLLFPIQPAHVVGAGPGCTFTTSYMDSAGTWKGIAVSVCVCWGGIAWRFLFFIFHVSIQQGNVLPYLGHHGVRETAWYCSQENTSFSWQRRTGHCLSLELLLLTDELKISQRRWDTCRKADAETRAHPALIRKHTHSISFYLLFLWQSLWALPVFPRGGNGTDVDLHVHRCVHFCVFKHGNVWNWEGKRNGYIFHFYFSIVPQFADTQCSPTDVCTCRLVCVWL